MKKSNGYRCHVEILTGYKTKQALLKNVINSRNPKNEEDAFYVGDLGDVVHKYRDWVNTLPHVEPFYAVKCNDHPAVLKTLADLGCNFDCASKHEMERVMKLGVSPKRIIFANPVKQVSFLRFARQHNVDLMTFDNEHELSKIKTHFPAARLILRILPPSNFKVQCELGMKFGCPVTKVKRLLQVAQELGLNIVGVSFHVGSGCEDASAFDAAICEAAGVYRTAKEMGFNVTILDIGGGFPGQQSAPVPFVKIADVVKASLARYVTNDPSIESLRVIAEPGRYFVASAFTLAVNVIAKRAVVQETLLTPDKEYEDETDACWRQPPSFMYYINDGVYGSFNCLLYDHATVTPQLLAGAGEVTYATSLWGPTCDGLDCVMKSVRLPELHLGDWLFFEDMGAYTMCAASTFNGMPLPRCHFYCHEDSWCRHSKAHSADACTCLNKSPYTKSDDITVGMTDAEL